MQGGCYTRIIVSLGSVVAEKRPRPGHKDANEVYA